MRPDGLRSSTSSGADFRDFASAASQAGRRRFDPGRPLHRTKAPNARHAESASIVLRGARPLTKRDALIAH